MEKENFLIVTHLPHFFLTFLQDNIRQLQVMGFDVHCASNFELDRRNEERLKSMGVTTHQIDIQRSPYSFQNLLAIRQLARLMKEIHAAGVHCHTPTGGVVCRLAAKKAHIKPVIYTAHGFHFYKGAPLKNWLLYYPVERFLARYTDVLITINQEDYTRAKSFNAGRVCYVPGVGIDLTRFRGEFSRDEKRRETGLAPDDFVLLSVGELIPRKNHATVIRALSKIKDEPGFAQLQYVICGRGILEEELKQTAEALGVGDRVHFFGYRNDIADICRSSDLFVFMSLQEGLPVALMEAMASGLPVICSDIRGNTDLIEDGVSGCVIKNDVAQLADTIRQMHDDGQLREQYAAAARECIQKYDLEGVGVLMRDIYTDEMTRGGYEAALETVSRRQALRREYGIPLDAFVLLSVGEVNYNKNHRLVIEALAQIDDSSIYYMICGQGPLMDEIRERARILGVVDRVILAGFCENIVDMYGIADVFVFPSFREGLPVALMEAMASGLPVICSKIRGNVDLVSEGINGLFFDSHVPEALADAIRRMKKEGISARKLQEEDQSRLKMYSTPQVCWQLKEIYSSAVPIHLSKG